MWKRLIDFIAPMTADVGDSSKSGTLNEDPNREKIRE